MLDMILCGRGIPWLCAPTADNKNYARPPMAPPKFHESLALIEISRRLRGLEPLPTPTAQHLASDRPKVPEASKPAYKQKSAKSALAAEPAAAEAQPASASPTESSPSSSPEPSSTAVSVEALHSTPCRRLYSLQPVLSSLRKLKGLYRRSRLSATETLAVAKHLSLIGRAIECSGSGSQDRAWKARLWHAVQHLTSAPLSASELVTQWEAAAVPHKQIHTVSNPARNPSPHPAYVQPPEVALNPSIAQGQLNTMHILRCIRSFANPGGDAGILFASVSADKLLFRRGQTGKAVINVKDGGRISSSAVFRNSYG